MPTQYGSRLDTFLAPDIFSALLSTKATPPADVAIAVADTRESFFFNRMGLFKLYAFSPRERLIMRRAGLWSNLGDGLVLNNANWEGGGPSLEVNLTGWAAQLTGTIQVVGTALTGNTTQFTRELANNIRIAYRGSDGLLKIGQVASITNATTATLVAATGNTTGFVTAYPEIIPNSAIPSGVTPPSGVGYTMGTTIPILAMNQLFSQEFFIGSPLLNYLSYSGTISVNAGGFAVTGTNTKFTTELAGEMFFRWLDDSGNMVTRQISSIASDTSISLNQAAPTTATDKALIASLNHLRLTGKIVNPLAFSTITIDPAFAAKYLNLSFVAEIEHTFDTIVVTE